MLSHMPGEGIREYSRLCGKLFALVSQKKNDLLRKKALRAKAYSYYLYYSNFLRYYLMLRNDIYLWIRRKIYFDFWKMIISDIVILCETLGYKNSFKWIFKAIKHGLVGDLDMDNRLLFNSPQVT